MLSRELKTNTVYFVFKTINQAYLYDANTNNVVSNTLIISETGWDGVVETGAFPLLTPSTKEGARLQCIEIN